MKAKALICDEQQSFSIEDVVLTDPAADQVAIRTHYTGVSVGTEFALIRNKIDALTAEGLLIAEELITPFKPGSKKSGDKRNPATPKPE